MKIDDLDTGQPVALVTKHQDVPKGSIGYVQGYSEKRKGVVITLRGNNREVCVPPSKLIGVLY